MDTASEILVEASHIVVRSGLGGSSDNRPPVYKAIGLTLAVSSGVFIGTSFVLKKLGLLKANAKYNEEAGEGYGYLKNAWWWSGMTLMIIGEVCNFVAYAFVDAILVTPLGALSVVITTILSTIFLKERLSFVGKVGCFNCIVGSIVIVMNAPEQSSVAKIQDMKHFVLAPGFLTYAGVILVGCAFIAFWVGPRYGKKSMLVYLSICSLIGGLSVVATQGLGAAVVAQAGGTPQFNQWFLYVLLVFVIATLVTEIIFLNKALNLFNAALVTPTYYVFFTSSTIVTSAVLFQGFKGTPVGITTVIMGFLQICAGVVLLQLSKSAKDVPDAAIFKGDLDQVREVAEQEQPESEPKADAIRGGASIIRRFSVSRQKMAEAEARRYREDRKKEQLEPLRENEIAEWDGLRRRKTIIGDGPISPMVRRKTIHPPLGMSQFPEVTEEDADQEHPEGRNLFGAVRSRTASVLRPSQRPQHAASVPAIHNSPMHPVALTEINIQPSKAETPTSDQYAHIYGLPPALRDSSVSGSYSPRNTAESSVPRGQSPAAGIRDLAPSNLPAPPLPPHSNRRQFSFTNLIHRNRSTDPERPSSSDRPTTGRSGIGSRAGTHDQKLAMKNATEEERLGLVKGDSHAALLSQDHHPAFASFHSYSSSSTSQHNAYHDSYLATASPIPSEDDEDDDWQVMNPLSRNRSSPPPPQAQLYHQQAATFPNPDPRSSPIRARQQSPQRPSLRSSQQSSQGLPTAPELARAYEQFQRPSTRATPPSPTLTSPPYHPTYTSPPQARPEPVKKASGGAVGVSKISTRGMSSDFEGEDGKRMTIGGSPEKKWPPARDDRDVGRDRGGGGSANPAFI